MDAHLEKLVSTFKNLQKSADEAYNAIAQYHDGFHYRLHYCQYGNVWDDDRVYNEFIALQDAMRCYCADYEGFATIFTNNPALFDEDLDLGDVRVKWESGD